MNNELPSPAARGDDANEDRGILRSIVAELCEVEPTRIGPEFRLATGRLRNSLGRAMLDAKIRRRLGVRLEGLHRLQTFGELEAALGRDKGSPAEPAGRRSAEPPPDLPEAPTVTKPPSLPVPSEPELACGIDAESVAALPEAEDYWSEPFYQTHFADAEIAYCIAQAKPKVHFAARWCAKEAFKKCSPGHAHLDMRTIEVARRSDGSPYILLRESGGATVPSAALSMTHTDDWAWAVVVVDGRERSQPASPPPPAPPRRSTALALAFVALAVSAIALAVSLANLLR